MGFGLLLCAFFLFTFMSVGIGDFRFATYMLGVMVALSATGKLKDYNPRFSWLYPVTAAYGLLAIYYAVVVFNDVFWWGLPIGGTNTPDRVIAGALVSLVEVSFTVIALWSSGELALDVGLERHHEKAKRNLFWVAVGATLQISVAVLMAIPAARAWQGGQVILVLQFINLILSLVIYFLCSLFFYSCFSSICPKGEEFGKPSKPSRFRFINEINAKLDAKNEVARQEYEAKMQEQNKKFSAKNNNRHHKKKK